MVVRTGCFLAARVLHAWVILVWGGYILIWRLETVAFEHLLGELDQFMRGAWER